MTKMQLGQITLIIGRSWLLKKNSLEAGKDILDSWKTSSEKLKENILKMSERKTKGRIMFSHCNDY